MAAAIELRDDFSGDGLRRLALDSEDAEHVRRLPALADISDGGTRTKAGVGLQIEWDWELHFNAKGPEGLVDRKATTLTAEQRATLARVVEAGPEPWRIDLVQWLWEKLRVPVRKANVERELRTVGFRTLSVRLLQPAQDLAAAEAFRKVSRSEWRRSGSRTPAQGKAAELHSQFGRAVLAKAFRRELVPQDQNDEPAEKLLDRMGASRTAPVKAPRGRRRSVAAP